MLFVNIALLLHATKFNRKLQFFFTIIKCKMCDFVLLFVCQTHENPLSLYVVFLTKSTLKSAIRHQNSTYA